MKTKKAFWKALENKLADIRISHDTFLDEIKHNSSSISPISLSIWHGRIQFVELCEIAIKRLYGQGAFPFESLERFKNGLEYVETTHTKCEAKDYFVEYGYHLMEEEIEKWIDDNWPGTTANWE